MNSCRNKETPKHADGSRPVHSPIRPAAGRTITVVPLKGSQASAWCDRGAPSGLRGRVLRRPGAKVPPPTRGWTPGCTAPRARSQRPCRSGPRCRGPIRSPARGTAQPARRAPSPPGKFCPLFKIRPGKGVFWGGVGVVLCSYTHIPERGL